MMAAAGSVLVLALATALLFEFFAQPLAAGIFLPLVVSIGVTGWFSPALGLSLYLVSALVTLQIPILAGTPFFAGPEPGFLALLAATALRRLRGHTGGGASPPWVLAGLTLHGGSAVLAAAAIWWSLRDLPAGWLWALSEDALSQIFFWRWNNPFNFFRMTLLFLEGVSAYWVAVHAVRTESRRALRLAAWSFALCAALLAGYSAVELLFRGKTISLYPGFGPVFNDRNAYAAFWVLTVPICLGLAGSLGGLRRLLVLGIAALGVACCLISLSLTGVVGMLAVSAAWTVLVLWQRGVPPPAVRARRRRVFLAAGFLVLAGVGALLWLQPKGLNLQERTRERLSFWLPAAAMALHHPLLGVGPGRYFQQLPEWRERLRLAKVSTYEHEHVHNYYLQLAAETGLPGLAGFLLAAGAVLVPGWRRLRPSPPGAEDSRFPDPPDTRVIAGLIVALSGLMVVSLAQHPLLLLSFQTWFWIVAGLVVGSRPPTGAARLRPVGAALAGLATVGVLHLLFTPHPAPQTLVYGIHLPGDELSLPENARVTEELAFIRSGNRFSWESLRLSSLHPAGPQTVEAHLNGHLRRFELQPGQSLEVGWEGERERWELGLRVFPGVPLVFPDSLGAGVVIEGLPASLEAEPAPRFPLPNPRNP
ncbi:MAG: hypothetical protein Kow001_19180 [Acidobacteriota bacterium]